MRAIDTFRKPPFKHNCAQAIAAHWRELYADSDIVEHYAPYVGGRAPEGYCGALYAAMQACPKKSETIRQEFAERCGALLCRDIKQNAHTPCETCVEVADSLVDKYSK